MKTWVKVTLGVVGFLFLLMFFSALFNPAETNYQTGNVVNENPDVEDSSQSEPLTILNHELSYGEFGNTMVVGTAQNTAGKQLSYAEVKVKFLDSEGAVIESFLDNINDLDAGEKWRFEVIYPGFDDEVADYSIAVGTTW